MIVDVDRLLPSVASYLLDELSRSILSDEAWWRTSGDRSLSSKLLLLGCVGNAYNRLYPKLRYVREVALTKLLSVDVVVDINGLFSGVAPKLLDEFAGHSSATEMGCEPVTTAVWREMVFHPI